jgi:hypothetical protein
VTETLWYNHYICSGRIVKSWWYDTACGLEQISSPNPRNFGVGITTLPCKKKIVEKPPRNSAGFCGEGQGLSWAVEPRKEEEESQKLESCQFNH